MTFNNTINHLKLWCINKAKAYQQAYGNYGGITYVGYQVAYEMEFKLSTLIDKSFDSVEDLKREVVNLIDVHYEPSVLNPQNSLAKHIIDKTNREFCEFWKTFFLKVKHLHWQILHTLVPLLVQKQQHYKTSFVLFGDM